MPTRCVDIRGTNNDVLYGACNHCHAVDRIAGGTVYERCAYCLEACSPMTWCAETFGYTPASLMFPDCWSPDQQGCYLFANETDAMLFRMAFAPDLDRAQWREYHEAGIFGPGAAVRAVA